MTLAELTLEVLGEKLLTQFDSKKLVEWAVNALKLGYESENLFVLAGLDDEATEEREKYFWKSVQDLDIEVARTEGELIYCYALIIARKAIKKEIDIDYAFSRMLKIVYASDFDCRYLPFFNINEDLDYIKYDSSIWITSGLTAENSKEFILEEFKIFVEMERLMIPCRERDKCYCERCKRLNMPLTKTKYQLRKPFKYLVWSCGFCRSDKLIFNSRHEVKRMIIKAFEQPAHHL
jgi:hypothetical protein